MESEVYSLKKADGVMKKTTLLLAAALLTAGGSVQAKDTVVSPYEPKVVTQDAEKIVIEITMPPLTVRPVEMSELRGQIVMMSGYAHTAEPGAPQLPLQAYNIAVPENAKPTLQILEQEVETRTLGDIVPAPKMKMPPEALAEPLQIEQGIRSVNEGRAEAFPQYVYERDQRIYGTNTFYPESPVTLGPPAIMRDVRIVPVQICPVQYNPVQGRVKYVKKLRFAVYFNAPAGGGLSKWSEQNASTPFEELYKTTLLNYEESKRFRLDRSVTLRKTGADDYFLTQGSQWCKLTLEKPGIYYVTPSDLAGAGMNLSGIDPRKFRLFNQGEEVAIRVIGEEDGSFDSGDVIEFHGTAFKNYYTTTNVYWLTVGSVNGKRMAVTDGTPGSGVPVLVRGKETYRYEIDLWRYAAYPGHTDNERWFSTGLLLKDSNPDSVVLTKNLPFVSDTTAGDAGLTVRIQGINAADFVNPDHHVIVKLNGTTLIDRTWDGKVLLQASQPFDQSLLVDGALGDNMISIIGPNDTGASADYQMYDYYELTYWKDYKTANDSLAFTAFANGAFQCHLQGFSTSAVDIYEVIDAANPKRITNHSFSSGHIYFQDSANGSKKYVAVASAGKIKPNFTLYAPASDLRSTSNRADLLIISHENFLEQAAMLAQYREAQGLSSKVIRVKDVYDQFNNGFYEERAIKNFLTYVYQKWAQPLPTYVVLLGDASWNPRILNPSSNGSDQSDFVPTRLFESHEASWEAGSDNWMAAVAGDDLLPEFFVGRFAARTPQQAQVMCEKVINYETDFSAGDWNRTVTFVADNAEASFAFEDSSDAFIRDLVPDYFIKNRVYIRDYGTGTKTAIKNAINSGTLVLNYYGHGSVSSWAQENIFYRTDVPTLRNDNKAPFLLTLSCANGYFLEPKESNSGLTEVFFRERQRGVVGAFSGTGSAYASPVLAMGRELYRVLFKEHVTAVGAFTYAGLAKMNALYGQSNPDHVMFYTLFGDPATRLHYQPSSIAASAGYQGVMAVGRGDTPVGTSLLATIDGRVMASALTAEKGAFGPLYVVADDPATPQKDGGAPGDSVLFKAVVGADTLRLTPKYPWKGGEVQSVRLKPAATGVDQALEITVYADGKKFGEELADGDFIARSAVLSAKVKALRGVPDVAALTVSLDGRELTPDEVRMTLSQTEGRPHIEVSVTPDKLPDGEHVLSIQSVGETAAEKSVRFRLESSLRLTDVVNFPNPMKEETRFTFVLQNDRAADIEIKIYTVAGRLIRVLRADCQVGYNEVPWDGRDADGDDLANGVYFYKVSAKDGDEKAEVIERLVVMK